MPVEDRAADTWEPLVVIADLAGGEWPALARTACRVMTDYEAGQDEEGGLRTRLLVGIRRAFAAENDPVVLGTRRLLKHLNADKEAPWAEYGANGLTPRGLQLLLQPYGISSANRRFPDGTQAKGFARNQFLAHYVGAVVMAHVHGDLALPGQRSGGGEHAARTSGWCNGHGGGSALCVEPHHSESGLFAATRVAAVGRPYRRPRRSRGVANEADARITGPRQARIPGWFAVDPLRSDKSWDRHWTRCHAQSRRPCPPTGQEAPCTGTPGRAIASYSVGPHGLPSWPGSLR